MPKRVPSLHGISRLGGGNLDFSSIGAVSMPGRSFRPPRRPFAFPSIPFESPRVSGPAQYTAQKNEAPGFTCRGASMGARDDAVEPGGRLRAHSGHPRHVLLPLQDVIADRDDGDDDDHHDGDDSDIHGSSLLLLKSGCSRSLSPHERQVVEHIVLDAVGDDARAGYRDGGDTESESELVHTGSFLVSFPLAIPRRGRSAPLRTRWRAGRRWLRCAVRPWRCPCARYRCRGTSSRCTRRCRQGR